MPGTAISLRSPPLEQMLIFPSLTTARSGRRSLSKSPTQKTAPATQFVGSRGTSRPPRSFSRSSGGPSLRLTNTSIFWSRFQSSIRTPCAPCNEAGIPDRLVMLVKSSGPNWRYTCTPLVRPVTAIRSSFPVKSRSMSIPSVALNVPRRLSDEASVASPFVANLKRWLPVSPSTTTSSKRSF